MKSAFNHRKFDPSDSSSKLNYPSSTIYLEKPSEVPNSEYVVMNKEQRRNLPDRRDGFITKKGHPTLAVRYGQTEFKTSQHGAIHNLQLNDQGKILKTEKNVLALRDSIVQMMNRKNVTWFQDGDYQGGTSRGYKLVNIYDGDTGVIAVFKKQTDGSYSQFSTTCKITTKEENHLFQSGGNFMTEAAMDNMNSNSITIINEPPNNGK